MRKLSLENCYKIVVPLFGAAFAAPNKCTIILYGFLISTGPLADSHEIKGFL